MSQNPVKDFGTTEQYRSSNILRCVRCGQTGVAAWEKNAHADANGAPQLVSLSEEFYERVARRAPYGIEIVCCRCDTVQAA